MILKAFFKVLEDMIPPTGGLLVSKQLNDPIWANWFTAHKLNDVGGHGRGFPANDISGAFVFELADGISWLCHISKSRIVVDRAGEEG